MKRPVDWHVHCFLPEHRSPDGVALQQRRNIRYSLSLST